MSEVIIVLIILAPVFIVVAILNRSRKRQEKAEQEKLATYLRPLLSKINGSPAYERKLVYQYLVLDEKEGKLLVVNWKDVDFSHEWHRLEDFRSLSVQTIRQDVAKDGSARAETITAAIGIEMTRKETAEKMFLTFYSHLEHSIYQMADFTTDAGQLCEKLNAVKTGKDVAV